MKKSDTDAQFFGSAQSSSGQRSSAGRLREQRSFPGAYERLQVLIESRQALVGVIGLGYVGLPLAHTFMGAGLRVLGFDIDASKLESLAEGRNYLPHLGDRGLTFLVAPGEELEPVPGDVALAVQVDAAHHQVDHVAAVGRRGGIRARLRRSHTALDEHVAENGDLGEHRHLVHDNDLPDRLLEGCFFLRQPEDVGDHGFHQNLDHLWFFQNFDHRDHLGLPQELKRRQPLLDLAQLGPQRPHLDQQPIALGAQLALRLLTSGALSPQLGNAKGTGGDGDDGADDEELRAPAQR